MVPKIKRYVRNNKKQVRIGLIILAVLIIFIILYKSLFYSSAQKAVYGVRLRDIKSNEFSNKDKDKFQDESSSVEGVKEARVVVKGRLIKLFVTFNDGISADDIKTKFTSMLDFLSEKVKGYYDIEFYAEQSIDGEVKYPVIGYKHKNNETIIFDAL